jgi:hypothetical protein
LPRKINAQALFGNLIYLYSIIMEVLKDLAAKSVAQAKV